MNNKGFTLIELLAVIVILAIIALIATPIILNIIDDAREESNKRSVEMYANAVENAVAQAQLNENKSIVGTYSTSNLPVKVEYDGDVECDTVQISEDGNIYLAGCDVNGEEIEEITYGTKTSICTISPDSTVQGTETGAKYLCKVDPNKAAYTFYVIGTNDDGTTNLIMDQNINSDGSYPVSGVSDWGDNGQNIVYDLVAWNLNGENTEGPVTVMPFLYNATKNWTNVPPLNYTYNDAEVQGEGYGYTSFVSTNGVAIITPVSGDPTTIGTEKQPLRARLPIYIMNSSKSEVLEKTNTNTYLYNNLSNGENAPFAYWTLSSYAYHSGGAWQVKYDGTMADGDSSDNGSYGVRPVITVEI